MNISLAMGENSSSDIVYHADGTASLASDHSIVLGKWQPGKDSTVSIQLKEDDEGWSEPTPFMPRSMADDFLLTHAEDLYLTPRFAA